MKISVVIPAYEARGVGDKLITELLQSISSQTHKDIEVVIPDHSTSDIIKDVVSCWQKELTIVHFFNENGRGNSSVNMNAGIKRASGDVIKIMHMDDVFCNEEALKEIDNAITNDKTIKWGAFGFQHNYEYENSIRQIMMPTIFFNPLIGCSALLGCPSVSFFVNEENLFDENLIIINDVDMHYRLEKKYGTPHFFNDVSVTIRMHNNQVTKILDNYPQKESKEIEYFKTKITTL